MFFRIGDVFLGGPSAPLGMTNRCRLERNEVKPKDLLKLETDLIWPGDDIKEVSRLHDRRCAVRA